MTEVGVKTKTVCIVYNVKRRTTVHPQLSEPQLSKNLDYPNRETMASLGDLNHFSYPNPRLSEYQGVRIIEGALYAHFEDPAS